MLRDLNIPLPSPGLQPGEPAAVVLLPGEPGTVGGATQSRQSPGAAQLTEVSLAGHQGGTLSLGEVERFEVENPETVGLHQLQVTFSLEGRVRVGQSPTTSSTVLHWDQTVDI